MTAQASSSYSGFTRDIDNAILGGVCAGFADHFGFNLRVARLLVVIAFFVAMPITIITYIALVLIVPAESRGGATTTRQKKCRKRRRRMSRKERRQAAEDERQQAKAAFEERCNSLNERLATVEKYVTSSRYSLDQEFRNL